MDKPFCSLPWGGIHINQQLDVFFCCLMASPENTLGNLRDQTLPEILNSDAARATRLLFQPLLVIWALWSTGAWRARRSR